MGSVVGVVSDVGEATGGASLWIVIPEEDNPTPSMMPELVIVQFKGSLLPAISTYPYHCSHPYHTCLSSLRHYSVKYGFVSVTFMCRTANSTFAVTGPLSSGSGCSAFVTV